MFIEFSFANFRSYKDLQTLSMIAADITSNPAIIDQNNTFAATPKLRLLHSKAIYGANASGKSNIVKALSVFIALVRHSVKNDYLLQKTIDVFQLNTQSVHEPAFFQLIFLHEGAVFRYGFEVRQQQIITEWLFGAPNGRETTYFLRENKDVDVKPIFKGAKRFATLNKENNEIFRDNALFLTAVATMGNKIAASMVNAIAAINLISGLQYSMIQKILEQELQNNQIKEAIIELLKNADIDMQDLHLQPANIGEMELSVALKDWLIAQEVNMTNNIMSSRYQYDEAGNQTATISKDIEEWESEGTKKMLYLSPILLQTLTEGKVLVIDEFDARLHPQLTHAIIALFHAPATNPHHAQLIFVTHDTSFLKPHLLRRDQICFVDKNSFGQSHLNTLVEFKGVRNDALYDKQYLEGAYGAIPFVKKMSQFFTEKIDQHEQQNQ